MRTLVLNPRPGFTLIELTLALSLIVTLMGLIVVRLPLGSARQELNNEARKLGNLINTYREKALDDEKIYGLRIDTEGGRYAVFKLPERGAALTNVPALIERTLPRGMRFGKIEQQGNQMVSSDVLIAFDAKGVLPPLKIQMLAENGVSIFINPAALSSEIEYVSTP